MPSVRIRGRKPASRVRSGPHVRLGERAQGRNRPMIEDQPPPMYPSPSHFLKLTIGTDSGVAGFSLGVPQHPETVGQLETNGWTSPDPVVLLSRLGDYVALAFGITGIDQYGTTEVFDATLQGYGQFTLTWNGAEYLSGTLPGIYNYLRALDGRDLDFNAEPRG